MTPKRSTALSAQRTKQIDATLRASSFPREEASTLTRAVLDVEASLGTHRADAYLDALLEVKARGALRSFERTLVAIGIADRSAFLDAFASQLGVDGLDRAQLAALTARSAPAATVNALALLVQRVIDARVRRAARDASAS